MFNSNISTLGVSFAKVSYPVLNLKNEKLSESPFEVASSISPKLNHRKQPLINIVRGSIENKSKIVLNDNRVIEYDRKFVKSILILLTTLGIRTSRMMKSRGTH